MSFVYQQKGQSEQALAEGKRAIALNPNSADGYVGLAAVLNNMGRPEEALPLIERALRLNPPPDAGKDWYFNSIGSAYYLAGQTEEAIAPLKRLLAQFPNHLGAHLILAAVYSDLGKEAEARAEAAEVLRINPKFSLEVHKQRVPIKDSAMLERHLTALHKAGLK